MTNPAKIRPATRDDVAAIAGIAAKTLFPAEMTAPMITPFLDGDDDMLWCVVQHVGAVAGFAYAQAEPMTRGSWNLKAIAIDPGVHRQGMGSALLVATEDALPARLLVVDTASGADQAAARAFYAAHGYASGGVIPDFWEPGVDKVVFFKRLP